MAEDYASAAFRHDSDANFLLGHGRLDNAGYLAGYVVECCLKALIACGEGPGSRALGHDLTSLAGQALTLAALLSPGLSRYDVTDDLDVRHVLAAWHPDCRYDATGLTTREEAERRLRAARASKERVLLPLILDGVLEVPR
jgi:HEPN domain-containing protein